MSGDVITSHRTLYLDPKLGWVEQETSESIRMMRCKSSSTSYVDNELFARAERGGWDAIPHDAAARLSGAERGYVFEVKPRDKAGRPFVEIRSVRYVDSALASELLRGLRLHDRQLEPLASPELAVDVFCIPVQEAETFYARVNAAGGHITEAKADLNAMYQAFQRLQQISEEVSRLCQQSRSVIERIADDGIATEAPAISDRSKAAYDLKRQAAGHLQSIRDEQLALESDPGMIQEKAWAAACVKQAQEFASAIDKLHAEHRSYEVQAANRIGDKLAQDLPSADTPAIQRRLMFTPAVDYYTARGYDVRIVEEGMVLRLDDGTVILLGAEPQVRLPGAPQAQSGDVLSGRGAAERGRRTL